MYTKNTFLFCSMCTLVSFLQEYLQLAYALCYRSELFFICLIFFNEKTQNQIETAGKIIYIYIYAQSKMQSCLLQAGAVISYNKANRQPVQNMPITHLCLQFTQSFAWGVIQGKYWFWERASIWEYFPLHLKWKSLSMVLQTLKVLADS